MSEESHGEERGHEAGGGHEDQALGSWELYWYEFAFEQNKNSKEKTKRNKKETLKKRFKQKRNKKKKKQ